MDTPPYLNDLTHLIIGKLIKVHRILGPGLLESIYRRCVAYELRQARCTVEEERTFPLVYEGMTFDCAFRVDVVVNGEVVVEIKAVDKLDPVHSAQLLSYLRLADCPVGLLANFHSPVLKDGLKRLVNGAPGTRPRSKGDME